MIHYGATAERVRIVAFGANLEEVPDREVILRKKRDGVCRLLFIARDWKRKGGDVARETLLALLDGGIAAELTVCGCEPPKAALHPRLRVLPLIDKHNARNRKIFSQLLLSSHFLLLPTRADCTPIVMCEANAFGVPVMTTSTGGIPSIVQEGVNGCMLPQDARGDKFAQLIATIFEDENHYARMVAGARAMFEQRLNWTSWGETMKEEFTQLTMRH